MTAHKPLFPHFPDFPTGPRGAGRLGEDRAILRAGKGQETAVTAGPAAALRA